MKIKTLATVIASALCTSSVAASVSSHPGPGLHQIKAAQLAGHAPVSVQQQKNNSAPNLAQRRPGAVNQQIRPASAADKFAHEPARRGEDVYIVRLNDLPVATYDGRVKGYAATSLSALRTEVNQGTLAAPRGPNGLASIQHNRAQGYSSFLQQKQQAVVQEARGLGIRHNPRLQFTDAINGFTMKMTQAQAKKLAESPNVAFIQRSDMLELHTDRGPEFIGADRIWNGNTDANSGLEQKGEGMIVGILDTGINTDHVSFADLGDDGYDHTNPWGEGNYTGDCATGASVCNDKLIGVWSWPVITDGYAGVRPASGEDYNGHGSHTASTAAGNVVHNVPLLGGSQGEGDGIPSGFEFEQVSGVAPHANIISYQVCIPNGGCPTEAVLKAVDQAIADGVDVINYSIGGGDEFPWDNAVALAFLSAQEAGISVAASAGNAGAGFYTLSHTAPWYTVVGATTTDRQMDVTGNGITLSGGATEPPNFYVNHDDEWDNIAGISASGIVDGTPIIAADYGDELCLNEFPAGTFASHEIVICKRGENARVAKAFNVKAGGAGGFILYNAGNEADSKLVDDIFPLPGLHIDQYRGEALLTWVGDGGTDHKLSITPASIDRSLNPEQGDLLADFSSRGPAQHFTGSLAPHISAPGVDILAAYADDHPFHPDSAQSMDWTMISGTSMASPHVAGAMALIRQVHPDWTPAEVQSALQMTAAETVREKISLWSDDTRPAHTYRAGAGRIDVAAAVNAGLVMDETAANFEYANPNNGGDVKQLNLPQLVNNHCRTNCSWIRTVRATRDGTWKVSSDDWTYDVFNTGEGETPISGARIEATPSSFTLKAGETQTIIFRADLDDVQWERNTVIGGLEELDQVELWGRVRFTPEDTDIPAAHWPVSINFDRGGLPSTVNVNVHRNNGAYHVKDLPLPAMSNLLYRGFGPVKASVEEITLNQDNNHIPVRDDNDYEPGHARVTLHEIPDNTARFVVEVLENVKSPGWHEWYGPLHGWMTVYIGRDANADGKADFDSEMLCASSTEIELNYCSITNPDPGMYWVVVDNHRINAPDYSDIEGVKLEDTYKVATALVPATATGLKVEGPTSTDGSKVGVDVKWNFTDFEEGDVAYAGFDIGAGSTPGSVGFVPLKLTRGVDDISLTTSQTRAKGGDIVDVTVHMVQNNSGIDREIEILGQLPEGLTLVEGSASITNPAMRDGLTVDGDLIGVTGVQENSEHWARDYKVTNSGTDQACRTPIYSSNGLSSDGGFVGLYERFGLTPDFGGTATEWTNPEFTIPLSGFWGEDAGTNLFHNEDYRSYRNLYVSPQGYVTLDQFDWFPNQHFVHQEFPYFADPYSPFLGVFWKGIDKSVTWFEINADLLGTPLDPSQGDGMVMGYAYDPKNNVDDIIIEWNNARTQVVGQDPLTWELVVQEDKADRYSFNLIAHKGYRFGEGEFEFTMAYGKLDFAGEPGQGSIGLHGNYGPHDIYGYPFWADQEKGKSFAFNDLDKKLKQDLVVCYDYVGPESTQFDLKFQVRVAETAAGQDLELAFVSDIDGMAQEAVAQIIVVPGNLTLAEIVDQSVAENTSLDLEVVYLDKDAAPNLISVSGEHIAAEVSGHGSGSMVTITPEANWYGETEITVTVADEQVPSDTASTSFMLTVASDGEEPGCIDMAANNYDENATVDDGSCVYPEPQPEPEKKKRKGGSTGTILIGLLIALGVVRRSRRVSAKL
ncbi:S8 family serine peptidase [Microbulbifer elongatus]|uniref:S8 family serine peptidase n=1 Tax=Microbulbifer elongatus TaxID=86173 RepID=UPI0022B22FCB|nr:S8 family serine peptidase [Microbulbifer elongatus]